MKLFGKDLFTYKKPATQMYDFAQHGLLQPGPANLQFEPVYVLNNITDAETAAKEMKKKGRKKKEEPPVELTAKSVYHLKLLNKTMTINNNSSYIKEQVAMIKDKLTFMGKENKKVGRSSASQTEPSDIYQYAGIKYGRMELESIMERLENRLKLDSFKTILDTYPHTTSERIAEVITDHKHLRCNRAEEFIPDFPKEAIDSMKEYDEECIKLCNRKSIYYVIANRSDFEKKNKRRDPILLAQSPFGHFWQILGAWDEEMIYLVEL